jgi:hypothetical protein
MAEAIEVGMEDEVEEMSWDVTRMGDSTADEFRIRQERADRQYEEERRLREETSNRTNVLRDLLDSTEEVWGDNGVILLEPPLISLAVYRRPRPPVVVDEVNDEECHREFQVTARLRWEQQNNEERTSGEYNLSASRPFSMLDDDDDTGRGNDPTGYETTTSGVVPRTGGQ